MRGGVYFQIFCAFAVGWVLLLIWLYQALGTTAQDQASLGFKLTLAALVVGRLAALVALLVAWIRDITSGGPGADDNIGPDIDLGPPLWDKEFDTGSTGTPMEDLGLVQRDQPLRGNSEKPRR